VVTIEWIWTYKRKVDGSLDRYKADGFSRTSVSILGLTMMRCSVPS
jgi:hypothetical protein